MSEQRCVVRKLKRINKVLVCSGQIAVIQGKLTKAYQDTRTAPIIPNLPIEGVRFSQHLLCFVHTFLPLAEQRLVFERQRNAEPILGGARNLVCLLDQGCSFGTAPQSQGGAIQIAQRKVLYCDGITQRLTLRLSIRRMNKNPYLALSRNEALNHQSTGCQYTGCQ